MTPISTPTVPLEDADAIDMMSPPASRRRSAVERVRPLSVPSREHWDAYTTYVRGGSSPAKAAECIVLQMKLHGPAAERLTGELLGFEQFCGLDESVPQYEERVRQEDADAALRDPAVVAAQAEQAKLDAIQAEAEQHAAGLREQIEKLAPEALVDADVKNEVLNLQSELTQAELAVQLGPMAARETARREAEAREAAAAEQREAAAKREVKLAAQVVKAEAEADVALAAAAQALARCKTLSRERAQAKAGSGAGPGDVRRSGWQEGGAAKGALRYHFHQARVADLLVDIGRYGVRDQPLRPQAAKDGR